MIEKIYKDVVEAYGSLDRPNWHFVQRRYSRMPYADVIEQLRDIGVVEETTDLNDDCSRIVSVSQNGLGISALLSLVGRYACIHDGDGMFFSVADLGKHPFGPRILQIMEHTKLTILDSEMLHTTITFGNETHTLYAVLFSTDELIF